MFYSTIAVPSNMDVLEFPVDKNWYIYKRDHNMQFKQLICFSFWVSDDTISMDKRYVYVVVIVIEIYITQTLLIITSLHVRDKKKMDVNSLE